MEFRRIVLFDSTFGFPGFALFRMEARVPHTEGKHSTPELVIKI